MRRETAASRVLVRPNARVVALSRTARRAPHFVARARATPRAAGSSAGLIIARRPRARARDSRDRRVDARFRESVRDVAPRALERNGATAARARATRTRTRDGEGIKVAEVALGLTAKHATRRRRDGSKNHNAWRWRGWSASATNGTATRRKSARRFRE